MSHEVIYDKSYLKQDKSLKSFDLTDSLISGLCSNSSRNESEDVNSDQSKLSNNKSEVESDNFKSESSFNKSETESNIKSESSFNKAESDIKSESSEIESITKKTENTNFTEKSESTVMEISDDSKNLTKSDYKFDSFDDKSSNKPIAPIKLAIKKSSLHKTKSTDKSQRFHSANILPARADPFIYDRKGKIITFNFDRCVSEDSTVMFGGNKGNFVFNPVNRTLTVGVRNKLHNCTDSSVINCTDVNLKNCKYTVAMGIHATEEDEFPENMNETLLVRNLHVAGKLLVNNIQQNSVYVKGNNQHDVFHQITRGDGIDIIYVNSIEGIIWIQFGTSSDTSFEANRTIVIKDITLSTGETSTHNTNVIVPPAHHGIQQTRIEYYNGKMLTVSSEGGVNAGYILNTAGGSVTYRYVEPFMIGQSPTWVIQQQFIGNPRIHPFPSTSEEVRAKLIKKY